MRQCNAFYVYFSMFILRPATSVMCDLAPRHLVLSDQPADTGGVICSRHLAEIRRSEDQLH